MNSKHHDDAHRIQAGGSRVNLSLARVAALAALLSSLLGCTTASKRSAVEDEAVARRELLQRPTLEAEIERLTVVRDEIGDALVREFALGGWKDRLGSNGAGCESFAGLEGEVAFLSAIGLNRALPDERWPDAVRIVSDIAGRHGFGEPQLVFDRPDQRLAVWRGERESRLSFKNIDDTSVRMEVGCHLPAASHANP